MSTLSKSLKLRIPSNIIYRALKDTRLETLFPEFFIGVERKVITDIINKEICFNTITQVYIIVFKLIPINLIYVVRSYS
jgi:hypothetical protein